MKPLLIALLLLLPAVAVAAPATVVSTPPYQVTAGTPRPVAMCLRSLNLSYLQSTNASVMRAQSLRQGTLPSSLACLSPLMNGLNFAWSLISPDQLLEDLESQACDALTGTVEGEMQQVGGQIDLPGGLGSVGIGTGYGSLLTNPGDAITGGQGSGPWAQGPLNGGW